LKNSLANCCCDHHVSNDCLKMKESELGQDGSAYSGKEKGSPLTSSSKFVFELYQSANNFATNNLYGLHSGSYGIEKVYEKFCG